MMDWTDRHCRYFLRGFSASALLYTEMITAAAILRGDRERLLAFHPAEHPVALQLGGSDPAELAQAARAGEEFGYDEINLNCGCPSDRVRSGAFGACLMRDGARVAQCVAAMRAVVGVPVTVKMRIGVVDGDARQRSAELRRRAAEFVEEDARLLHSFVRGIADAGCEAVIVHARKAVLGGWSPEDNREIPPLRYDVVEQLKRDFPGIPFVVNGGLRQLAAIEAVLGWADGVMLGREAYHNPMILAELERLVSNRPQSALPSRAALLERMALYAESQLARGERLSAITRHVLGLCTHRPGAKEFRRLLSEGAREAGAGPQLLRRAALLCGGDPASGGTAGAPSLLAAGGGGPRV